MLVWIAVGRPVAMKNWVNWGNGFAIGEADSKIVPKQPRLQGFPIWQRQERRPWHTAN